MLETRVNGPAPAVTAHHRRHDLLHRRHPSNGSANSITLAPGDVIATGTPAGVGSVQEVYLQAGDVVDVEITGLGTLEQHRRCPPDRHRYPPHSPSPSWWRGGPGGESRTPLLRSRRQSAARGRMPLKLPPGRAGAWPRLAEWSVPRHSPGRQRSLAGLPAIPSARRSGPISGTTNPPTPNANPTIMPLARLTFSGHRFLCHHDGHGERRHQEESGE